MCGCTGGTSSGAGFYTQNSTPEVVPTDCDIDKSILVTWKAIVLCIKNGSKQSLVGLSSTQVNSILGIIQSGLNYPDNYCYYAAQLEYFKTVVLPQIVENAAECIS